MWQRQTSPPARTPFRFFFFSSFMWCIFSDTFALFFLLCVFSFPLFSASLSRSSQRSSRKHRRRFRPPPFAGHNFFPSTPRPLPLSFRGLFLGVFRPGPFFGPLLVLTFCNGGFDRSPLAPPFLVPAFFFLESLVTKREVAFVLLLFPPLPLLPASGDISSPETWFRVFSPSALVSMVCVDFLLLFLGPTSFLLPSRV